MRTKKRLPTWLAIVVNLLAPDALHAQGCALCYQSAAASGIHFIQALRSGILILLLAPLVVFAAIVILAYRKRGTHESVGDP